MLGLFSEQLLAGNGSTGTRSRKIEPNSLASRSWDEMRDLFPLSRERAYLNNGTMGPSPQPVIDAYVKSIEHTNVSGVYGGGKPEALEALSRFLNCDKEELAITHNVTEGINIAAWGVDLKPGDEIILSKEEHVGNGLPWLHRAKADGLVVRTIALGATADETLQNIRSAISPKTRVIAVPHIPCTNGQVLPIREICALARARNILSFVDGAHGTGMMPLDLHDMGCDVYASCCHKWLLGPKGTGYLYVRKEYQDELRALFVGGYSGLDWHVHEAVPFIDDNYTVGAHRYYYGTQSAAQYFGIQAAVEFQEAVGKERIRDRIAELNEHLFQGLRSLGTTVEILTPEERISRLGVVAFRIRNKDNNAIKSALHEDYEIRFVAESNLNSLRVSTHIYNSMSELDGFLKALSEHI